MTDDPDAGEVEAAVELPFFRLFVVPALDDGHAIGPDQGPVRALREFQRKRRLLQNGIAGARDVGRPQQPRRLAVEAVLVGEAAEIGAKIRLDALFHASIVNQGRVLHELGCPVLCAKEHLLPFFQHEVAKPRQVQPMDFQRPIRFHLRCQVVHDRLVPVVGLQPLVVAPLEVVFGGLGSACKEPSDVDLRVGIIKVLLELDFPGVVGQRQHICKRVSRARQADVAVKKHKIIAVLKEL